MAHPWTPSGTIFRENKRVCQGISPRVYFQPKKAEEPQLGQQNNQCFVELRFEKSHEMVSAQWKNIWLLTSIKEPSAWKSSASLGHSLFSRPIETNVEAEEYIVRAHFQETKDVLPALT